MGYDTYRSLTVYNDKMQYLDPKEQDFHKSQIIDNSNEYEVRPLIGEDTRWYSYEEDMREYSLKYPDLIFMIYSEGNNSDDFYESYFKNGKCQICWGERVFPEYDESKLQ